MSIEELEAEACEIIPDRLYFCSLDGNPPEREDIFCFSIDQTVIFVSSQINIFRLCTKTFVLTLVHLI